MASINRQKLSILSSGWGKAVWLVFPWFLPLVLVGQEDIQQFCLLCILLPGFPINLVMVSYYLLFLLLMYLKKPFSLSLTSLDRFNSRWALAFRVSFLCILKTSPYPFQVAWPYFHLLYRYTRDDYADASIMMRLFSIHAGLLLPLPDFFFVRMYCSWPVTLLKLRTLCHPGSYGVQVSFYWNLMDLKVSAVLLNKMHFKKSIPAFNCVVP